MDEAAVREKLAEISQALMLVASYGKAPDHAEGTGFSLVSTKGESLEDFLDQVRLQIKYLMFDLEATRRENRYLRQMLENRRPPRSEGFDSPGDY